MAGSGRSPPKLSAKWFGRVAGVGTAALLLVSGIVIWQPWFAPWFSIGLNRVAVLIHALAAFVIIAGIIVHIYAAIWVKGSVHAMTRGTVTPGWAWKHHRAWYREMIHAANSRSRPD